MVIMNKQKKGKKNANAVTEKQIYGISNETRDEVLTRYLRFCKDQHAFTFLSFRRKITQMDFTYAERVGYRLRVGMRKGRQYALRDPKTDELVTDPDLLGERMTCLIPCLDPSTNQADRNDVEIMSERYLNTPEIEAMSMYHDVSSNFLAENFPVYYSFYPSDEVMRKLIVKMIQVKDQHELDMMWGAFKTKKVLDEEGNETEEPVLPIRCYPKKILFYYEL